jgi:hypothetical protein
MQNFFVLGLIPGTTIQITFTLWFSTVVLVASTPFLTYAWHRRARVYNYTIALELARFIDRFQLPA